MRYRVDWDPKLGRGMSASTTVEADSVQNALKQTFEQSGIRPSDPPRNWRTEVTPQGGNTEYHEFQW